MDTIEGETISSTANSKTTRADRKQQTRSKILDAAKLHLDELIDEGKIEFSRHASMQKIAALAGVSKTTVYAHFEDIFAVCAALKLRSRQAGRAERPAIEHAGGLHYTRGADPETRLAARLQHKTVPLDDALEIVGLAEKQKANVIIKIQAASAVARAYLRRQTPTEFLKSLDWVEKALALVDDDHIDHIRAALEATEIAAQAALRLSRDDSQEARYLRHVRDYKRIEVQYARRLHYLWRAAMAAFHVARATALLEDDIDSEISAFTDVSAALEFAAKGGEPIDADDIAILVARLCGVQLAYPQRAHELTDARNKLLRLLRPRASRSAIKALITAVDSAPHYDADTTGIDMMQMLQFGTVGNLCVGRMLERKYHQTVSLAEVPPTPAVSDSEPSDRDRDDKLAAAFGLPPNISHVLTVDPDEFLVAALNYYARARSGTRKSGSAGTLREQAVQDRERLLTENSAIRDELEATPIPAMNDDTVAGITAAIDRLVMRGLVAERADIEHFLKIRRHIDPIYQFLSEP